MGEVPEGAVGVEGLEVAEVQQAGFVLVEGGVGVAEPEGA